MENRRVTRVRIERSKGVDVIEWSKWVEVLVVALVLCGMVVLLTIMFSPNVTIQQTKGALAVGAFCWIACLGAIWASGSVNWEEIEKVPPAEPALSNQEYWRARDRVGLIRR